MERCDVAIVGAGPVGLLLGCLLVQRGLAVRVLERTRSPRDHSRAIGIHPPGLACLAEVGAADAVLAAGVRVRRGLAFGGQKPLGDISFAHLSGPYPFVLSAPQSRTEQALETRLEALAPGVLTRDAEVIACTPGDGDATLTARGEGTKRVVRARFVVGCDGKHSLVREAARIAYPGGAYRRARFVMADVDDDTPFGDDAAVFLTREGVVESFPLPGGQRRWVVGLGKHDDHAPDAPPTAAAIERLVALRTGQLARAESATMLSAFTAEHHLARKFAEGTLVLAGDAAHVISPIGGQGMNLGWLDAKLLTDVLVRALARPSEATRLLGDYGHVRRKAAEAARRRAELYMGIGQTLPLPRVRELLVQALLTPAVAEHSAKVFAMHGLGSRAG
ncbi:MAG: NAD(P)/FAD-dependent oxidoreductase [Polyangiales bacterium]